MAQLAAPDIDEEYALWRSLLALESAGEHDDFCDDEPEGHFCDEQYRDAKYRFMTVALAITG